MATYKSREAGHLTEAPHHDHEVVWNDVAGDEAKWHGLRSQDITSTEVSALFGCCPYVTEFELWHRKKTGVTEDIAQTERMQWGNLLEEAIAREAMRQMTWAGEKVAKYARIPALRIGASFDFAVMTSFGWGTFLTPDTRLRPEEDPAAWNKFRLAWPGSKSEHCGLLEIKNVSWPVYRSDWIEEKGDDGKLTLLAPPHIEMQVQHQMLVSGKSWCGIAVLVAGNELKVTVRQADPVVQKAIQQRVAAFWASIEANRPPAPHFPADAEFITKKLYNKAIDGTICDSDTTLDTLLAAYHEARQNAKTHEERADSLKAQILMHIGPAAAIRSPIGNATCGVTKENKGTLITPEMVGTYIGGRKAFRQFRFTPRKDK